MIDRVFGSKITNAGFTLVECITAFLMLAVIHLGVLAAIQIITQTSAENETNYTAGMLLGGLIAYAQNIDEAEIPVFDEAYILEFFAGVDAEDKYDFLVVFRSSDGQVYEFSDMLGALPAWDFLFLYTPGVGYSDIAPTPVGSSIEIITSQAADAPYWEVFAACFTKDGRMINAVAGRL